VLLYELLTGSTPFDTVELLKSGLDEIRRVIREEEPVRPSTRLSKLSNADLTTVAQSRHSEPPALIRTVHGDLDWIVMKALEKDRTRRYPTPMVWPSTFNVFWRMKRFQPDLRASFTNYKRRPSAISFCSRELV